MAALTGIRVLDLSRLLPGPYATRLLAELGAEVIKIEDPSGGDYTRWMPPLAGDPPTSTLFTELNRGKQSVALDLKRPEHREALLALVARSDVLLDSFRPGVLTRLGLDPSSLCRDHPKLVYVAMTGFGLTGPDRLRAGHDLGFLARAGALGISGIPEQPIPPGFQVADVGAAFVAVSGILAALLERVRTGQGGVVDVSLTESAMAFNASAFGLALGGEAPRRGLGLLDGSRPCYSVYRTKDGFLAVGALEPKFWREFLGALGLEALEPHGLDSGEAAARVRARIEARLVEKTRDEWMAVFRGLEACVEPVLDLDEVRDDPHLRARAVFDERGMARSPIRVGAQVEFGSDATPPLSAAPMLGEHTEVVLRAAGLDTAAIQKIIGSAG